MSALLRDNDSQKIARNSGHKLPSRRNPAFNARLKGDGHRSRGQRPRFTLQKNIRPVRANQTDHVHVLCNLTKKFPTAKVVEILKKDSSKFIKTLGVPTFHWQDRYGLFSVSPSHFEAVRKYILDQEKRHKHETFQDEYLRILKKYRACYDERYLWD